MNKLITSLKLAFLFVFLGIGSVNAQSHLEITEQTTINLTQENINLQSYLSVATQSWQVDRTYCGVTGTFYNMSSVGRMLHIDVKNVETIDVYVSNTNAGRAFSIKVGSASAITETHGGAGCENFVRTTTENGEIRITLEGGGSSVYPAKIVLTPPAAPTAPTITSFSAAGVEAVVDQEAKTIQAELPFGTSVVALEPVVEVGGSAIGYSPSGPQDFSNSVAVPVVYTATDGTNNVEYAVTLTVSATASSDKSLTGLTVGSLVPDAEGDAYSLIIPKNATLIHPVVFEIPVTATADFVSGTEHNFASPLTITVTAQDASTQSYTITVSNGIADIAYVVNTSGFSATDTKVYPMLKEKGYYLKVVLATGTDLTQFDPYQLVVVTEAPTSSNTLLVELGKLIGVKPLLNLKAYMYNRANWPTGAGNNGASDQGVEVVSSYLGHPIFSGITLLGNYLQILQDGIEGNGIQAVTNPGAGTIMATLPSNPDLATIIEQNDVAAAKYLLIPISNINYGNIAPDGLKLIENAVAYLLTDDKFITTSYFDVNLNSLYFDGQIIRNPKAEYVQVFDTAGRIITSANTDIQLDNLNNGIYIIRGESSVMKIAITR